MFSGVLKKCSGLFPPHVLLQNLRLGSEQVDHDQAVDDAAESLVDVEARQTAAALEVLAQQHRRALAIRLDLFQQLRDIVQVREPREIAIERSQRMRATQADTRD